MARLLASVRRRIVRLVRRHGIDLERPSDEVHPTDLLALEFPALAAISSASVVSRMAIGAHAGARLVRIGRDPDAAFVVSSRGPRQAHLDGFDLP